MIMGIRYYDHRRIEEHKYRSFDHQQWKVIRLMHQVVLQRKLRTCEANNENRKVI